MMASEPVSQAREAMVRITVVILLSWGRGS